MRAAERKVSTDMSGIVKRAVAGTLESSDVFVEIEPGDSGIEVEIESVVLAQFGDAIRAAALDVLKQQNVSDARVRLTDRGALDCVIRARVETAVARAKGE